MKLNRIPPKEMYELAIKKLGSHEAVVNWFFESVFPGTSVTPQGILNINGDFLVMEMLEELPNYASN